MKSPSFINEKRQKDGFFLCLAQRQLEKTFDLFNCSKIQPQKISVFKNIFGEE
jgi:hypothetical protein